MKIRVFKDPNPRNPRYPWGASYPCCSFMGQRGGWPTWKGAMGQVQTHLRDHAEGAFDYWPPSKRTAAATTRASP